MTVERFVNGGGSRDVNISEAEFIAILRALAAAGDTYAIECLLKRWSGYE